MSNKAIIKAEERELSTAQDTLERLAKTAARLIENDQAQNTRRSYDSYWGTWKTFCSSIQARDLPADPVTVVAWIADMVDKGKTISTIRVGLAAVKRRHVQEGFESPTVDPMVVSTLRGAVRTHGAPRAHKKGISVAQLRTMVSKIDRSEAAGARDFALLLTGWFGGFRRSELSSLRWSDVDFSSEEGVSILVRRSKTDKSGHGVTKGLPYHPEPVLCPVRALLRWQKFAVAQGRGGEDAVFAPVSSASTISAKHLTGESIAKIVKKTAEQAGIDSEKVSGHSLRRGFATEAVRQGKRLEQIQRHLAHSSITTTSKYVDEATRFDESNPARGLS